MLFDFCTRESSYPNCVSNNLTYVVVIFCSSYLPYTQTHGSCHRSAVLCFTPGFISMDIHSLRLPLPSPPSSRRCHCRDRNDGFYHRNWWTHHASRNSIPGCNVYQPLHSYRFIYYQAPTRPAILELRTFECAVWEGFHNLCSGNLCEQFGGLSSLRLSDRGVGAGVGE